MNCIGITNKVGIMLPLPIFIPVQVVLNLGSLCKDLFAS